MTAWAPTVADVGALLHARTKDSSGNELGTFTANTRPTDTQVSELIDQAVDDVITAIGQSLTISPDTYDTASKVAALGAAMLVELSFFPEQVGSGRSPYAQMLALYNTRLERLKLLVEAEGGDTPSTEWQIPAGSFGGPPIPMSMYYPPL